MSESAHPFPAFTTSVEQYRPALTGHCNRMLGSVVDAEDAVQEAMLRAWKSMGQFREQSSLKTWLYKIATNVGTRGST
jgi:RNA polymerase sigma-70 factor (ECF subfamily)